MVYINLECEEGKGLTQTIYTTSIMMRGVEIEGLRVLHTLLLGVIIVKLCYKNKHKEGREGEGYNTLHTHYSFQKYDYIKFYTAVVYLNIDLATYDIIQKPALFWVYMQVRRSTLIVPC